MSAMKKEMQQLRTFPSRQATTLDKVKTLVQEQPI